MKTPPKKKEVKMKPCPWCDREPITTSITGFSIYYGVKCMNTKCPIQPKFEYLEDSRERAVKLWNTRAKRKGKV